MIYSIENTELFFKVFDDEIANSLDSLIVTANLLGKKVKVNRYSNGNHNISINGDFTISFQVNSIGYLSEITVIEWAQKKTNGGAQFYKANKIIDGIKFAQSLL